MILYIKRFLKQYKSLIVYLVFGVLTTGVNYAVYYPLYNITAWSATVSHCVAWCAAVLFAFFTNKSFVFHSKDWSLSTAMPEFVKFVGCRLGSGLVEAGILCLTVDLAGFDGNITKLITSVLVIVLNYVSSKYMAFR